LSAFFIFVNNLKYVLFDMMVSFSRFFAMTARLCPGLMVKIFSICQEGEKYDNRNNNYF